MMKNSLSDWCDMTTIGFQVKMVLEKKKSGESRWMSNGSLFQMLDAAEENYFEVTIEVFLKDVAAETRNQTPALRVPRHRFYC